MRSDPSFQNELNRSIDYDTVLTQIAGFASFSCSKQAVLDAMPSDDLMQVRSDLALAKEAIAYLQAGGDVSMGGISDISLFVQQACKGITLLPAELQQIASFLAACYTVHQAFEPEQWPLLAEIAQTIDPCRHLFESISDAIDLSGGIREDASPALRGLHAQLVCTKADLSVRGRNFVKKNSSALMENMTTTIGGRMCVLLKAGDKYRFGGMIHGSSQSGQAFYVEPQEFVELNNDIQSIQVQIEEEKKRICKELTRQVRSQSQALDSDLESLTVLDLALTKGRWAQAVDGTIPLLQTRDKEILIENARHPLIDKSRVVANTYTLKPDQYCLMISGPNMGGKTVTLKTIGLFVALAQAGFPVSAHRAVLPFYTSLFFDIGDNQSIENNLSTFSSHVSRLSEITRQADERTFILLDEVGNGTDPLEGSTLAQAILEYLMERRSTIITSTHYNDVKAYGKSDSRVLVSSVEFDPETLRPTYRYIPGVSGASYAFQIASQFDLDPAILQRAQALKIQNESEVQKQLEQLEIQQQKTLARQQKFDAMIAQAHQLQKDAAIQKEKWEKKKQKLDETYESQLEAMLDEKKDEAKAILKEMRQKSNALDHEQIAIMAGLDALRPEEKKPKKQPVKNDWKVGDYVHVEILNNHGEILSLNKKKAMVLINGRRMNVDLDQLSPMKRPKAEKPKNNYTPRTFTAFPLELNLIGMRVEEGIQALDHYLDQAVYHRMKSVRIIHGMGTGALRTAVWKDLAKQPSVKSYTAAGPNEGGLGATLVELK